MSICELFRILWAMPAQQLLYSFETARASLNSNNTNLTLHYKFHIAQKINVHLSGVACIEN